MDGIAGVVRDVLTPHVGEPLAELTVRSAAIAIGKTAQDLHSDDMPRVIEAVRRMMSGVATQAHIDRAVLEIRSRTATA